MPEKKHLHLLTHSKTSLTKYCGHPFGPGQEWQENKPGRGARVGSAFHLLVEHFTKGSHVRPKALLAQNDFTGTIARDAEGLWALAKPWVDDNVPIAGSGYIERMRESGVVCSPARAEIGMAYDYQKGSAREIPMQFPRDYSAAHKWEVPGTIDLCWTEEDQETGMKTSVVYDWETGRSYYKGAAHSNDQIAIGALCVALTTGFDDFLRVGILHVGDRGVEVREGLYDRVGIECLIEDYRERLQCVERVELPTPGPHCHSMFCPIRTTCSVAGKAVDAMVEAAPDDLFNLDSECFSLTITSDKQAIAALDAIKRAQAFLSSVEAEAKRYIKEAGGVTMPSGKVYGPHMRSEEKINKDRAIETVKRLVDEGRLTEEELDRIAPRTTSKSAFGKALGKERGEYVLDLLREEGTLKKVRTTRWEEK